MSDGWNFACTDWEERLKEGRSLLPELPLDADQAEKAVGIFNYLRLPDVPGQPLLEDAAGDWIRDIVRALFGSIDPQTGARHVGELFLQVPKKNSKTTNAAAIALTALLMNQRPNAALLFIGPTQEVAQLAYDQAVGMIEADVEGYLLDRFHTRDHVKEIVDRVTGAVLKIKTFDTKVMTGTKPIFVLLDELHVMSAFSQAARVMTQIRGGLQPFPESLFVMITTQSDQPPAGVYKSELQYARGVRDGRITNRVRMLPVLYEFPEEMQRTKAWLDPANWSMVLPNLGRSISLDRLISDFEQAKEKGEAELRIWASQHLNVEIGLALHTDRWRGADYWEAAHEPGLTLDTLLERSEVVVAGVDGGGLDDLLGLSLLGRDYETKDWLHWSRAWAQKQVLERRPEIVERLRDFEADGDLVICEHATQDIEELADLICEVADAGLLPDENAIGLDPAGVAAIIDALTSRGVSDAQIAGIPQGYRLTGAVWGMERKLANMTFRHCGQPLMAWSVGNAKGEQRGNATLITKETAGKAKIDPLMSAFDAFVLMSRNPEGAGGPSVYETRGLLEIEV